MLLASLIIVRPARQLYSVWCLVRGGGPNCKKHVYFADAKHVCMCACAHTHTHTHKHKNSHSAAVEGKISVT